MSISSCSVEQAYAYAIYCKSSLCPRTYFQSISIYTEPLCANTLSSAINIGALESERIRLLPTLHQDHICHLPWDGNMLQRPCSTIILWQLSLISAAVFTWCWRGKWPTKSACRHRGQIIRGYIHCFATSAKCTRHAPAHVRHLMDNWSVGLCMTITVMESTEMYASGVACIFRGQSNCWYIFPSYEDWTWGGLREMHPSWNPRV